MTTFHPRSSIGLIPPDPRRLTLRTVEDKRDALGLTVHHTGYGGTLYKPDPIARLRGIASYHIRDLGYGDIAYEGAFDADNNTYELRDSKWRGAHALGTRRGGNIPNRLTDGIVFLEDRRGWTQGATQALSWWADVWHLTHGELPHYFAHEWWSITECPGRYLIGIVLGRGGSA